MLKSMTEGLWGVVLWAAGDAYPFRKRINDPIDERVARAAWAEHREELIERHRPYTCWAARTWEGAPGTLDPYEGLVVVGRMETRQAR
jgi:hypothetical protein